MKRMICTMAVLLVLCVSAMAQEAINDGVISGVEKVPACVAQRFSAEGRTVHVTEGRIEVKGSLIREPYNVVGFFYANGDIYISTHWDYSDAFFERVVLHEFGHYLEYSTRPAGWTEPPPMEERERFADSFAEYILRPDELQVNDPTCYADIEKRLHEMKSDLEETNNEQELG